MKSILDEILRAIYVGSPKTWTALREKLSKEHTPEEADGLYEKYQIEQHEIDVENDLTK